MKIKHILSPSCLFVISAWMLTCTGCKKFVDVGPPTYNINSSNVYNTDATAIAVMTGIYTTMSNANAQYTGSSPTNLYLYAGLSADELTLYNLNDPFLPLFYRNNLSSLNESGGQFWSGIYPIISICNSAIAGLNTSSQLTPAVRNQLLGEAKFIRAFCNFYLVNLYGDVPLVTSTDYTVNASIKRSPEEEIYKQIVQDLMEAKQQLNTNYLDITLTTPTTERVRPSKWTAAALLSRVYLYKGDFANAKLQADTVINNRSLFNLDSLKDVFLKNSSETIWSLQPVGIGAASNTGEGATFILPPGGPNTQNQQVYLSNDLMNSFENGDKRKANWTNSVTVNGSKYYYAYKYKIGQVDTVTAEYIMVMRLGEQYLIRAEAEANGAGGGLNNSIADLNVIRARAGLADYAGPRDQVSIISAILHERRVELFTEWGHRWLDLKRTKTVDNVMSVVTPQKGGTWSPFKSLYPIPISEIKANHNLVQNPGY